MSEHKTDFEIACACAKSHLIDFSVLTSNGEYEPAWFHEDIADKLMAVERGEIDRLMIFMPPRHGKSQLASINFPAWYLGRNPTKEIITSSYSAELSQDFGSKTRDLVNDPVYKEIFDIELREDQKSKAKWSTNKKGSYTSVGVGGAITGRGANILIVDDPIKNREEANSQVYRDKVWDWYRSTALTRLQKGKSAVIVILTRWHDDDLAGRILENSDEGDWTIIKYPAEALEDEKHRKKGEALWESAFNLKRLARTKKEIGSLNYSALYQQTPVLSEDQEFKPEWVKTITEEELEQKRTRNYMTIDTAISQKDTADFTGVVENFVDNEGFWNIRSQQLKINPKELIDFLFSKHKENNYNEIGIEETVYSMAIRPFLEEEMRARGIHLPIVPLKHKGTAKETRIRGLIPRYQSGSIKHIQKRNNDLELQMWAFPYAKHDDILDSLAYMTDIVRVQGAKPNYADIRVLSRNFRQNKESRTNYE